MKKQIAVCLLCSLICFSGFAAGKAEKTKSVTVTGTGIVFISPDRATINLSVVTRATEASKASQENAALMTTVQKAVSPFLKEGDTIHTSNFSVYQETSYNEEISNRVSNDLTIVVKQMDSVSAIIDAAIAAGANQFSSLRFSATNTEDAVKKARTLAVENAQEAAQTLATAAGAKLGNILFLDETSTNHLPRWEGQNTLLKSASTQDNTPIMPGNSNVSITVMASWELK